MSDEQRYNLWYDEADRWACIDFRDLEYLHNKYQVFWTNHVLGGFTMKECQTILASPNVHNSARFSIRLITHKSDKAARQAHAEKYL